MPSILSSRSSSAAKELTENHSKSTRHFYVTYLLTSRRPWEEFSKKASSRRLNYQRTISTLSHISSIGFTLTQSSSPARTMTSNWATLMRLYHFGQARQVPLLQNAVMDGFIMLQRVKRWTPLDQIRLVYDETLEHSPLRRLYVDKTINSARSDDPTWFSEATYDLFCPRFLFDVSKAYCERVAGKGEEINDFWAIRGNYHV